METDMGANDPQVASARPHRGWIFVLQTGLLTTALALAAVYLLSSGRLFGSEINVMGFYLQLIIPAGALAVGFVAGIGYGWAAWYTGSKLTRRMLAGILALQIAAYFIAQYIEFRQYDFVYETGEPVGFWHYFHLSTMSWTWEQKDGSAGEPLGAWGYAFRGLEIIGFALGGLILPGIFAARPYCDTCRLYKKSREIGLIRASVPLRKIAKDDAAAQAAYEDEQQRMLDAAGKTFDRLKEVAKADDVETFRNELKALEASKSEVSKLPARIRLEMEHCPGCGHGTMTGAIVLGQGENARVELLDKVDLSPAFVLAFTKG